MKIKRESQSYAICKNLSDIFRSFLILSKTTKAGGETYKHR